MNLDAIDPDFVKDLAASRAGVLRVASWLQNFGYSVLWPPTLVRPDTSQIADYSDAGDLQILQTVEVKHRQIAFSSRDNFPFPTVIVDSAHVYDARRPKPYAHVICNRDLTGALIVPARSRAHWKRTDNVSRGRTRTVYECPITETVFCELPCA